MINDGAKKRGTRKIERPSHYRLGVDEFNGVSIDIEDFVDLLEHPKVHCTIQNNLELNISNGNECNINNYSEIQLRININISSKVPYVYPTFCIRLFILIDFQRKISKLKM